MDAQHQASHSRHVVDVREANEAHCCQVMDEHNQEVLEKKRDVLSAVHNNNSSFIDLFIDLSTL